MQTFVYFIADSADRFVKIGVGSNLEMRLRELQVGNPLTLRVVHSFVGSFFEEKELHQRFRAERVRGEWFHFRGEVVRYLASEPLAPCPSPFQTRGQEMLAKWMRDESLTQVLAAERLGVSQQQVSGWLGGRMPTIQSALLISRVANILPDLWAEPVKKAG